MKTQEKETKPTVESLVRTLVSMVVGIVVFFQLMGGDDLSETMWITSPSGKTTIKLPLDLARRIVRKKGWTCTATEPIRNISRKEAIKILLKGDKKPNALESIFCVGKQNYRLHS